MAALILPALLFVATAAGECRLILLFLVSPISWLDHGRFLPGDI